MNGILLRLEIWYIKDGNSGTTRVSMTSRKLLLFISITTRLRQIPTPGPSEANQKSMKLLPIIIDRSTRQATGILKITLRRGHSEEGITVVLRSLKQHAFIY